jgi:hypothetical protein
MRRNGSPSVVGRKSHFQQPALPRARGGVPVTRPEVRDFPYQFSLW